MEKIWETATQSRSYRTMCDWHISRSVLFLGQTNPTRAFLPPPPPPPPHTTHVIQKGLDQSSMPKTFEVCTSRSSRAAGLIIVPHFSFLKIIIIKRIICGVRVMVFVVRTIFGFQNFFGASKFQKECDLRKSSSLA